MTSDKILLSNQIIYQLSPVHKPCRRVNLGQEFVVNSPNSFGGKINSKFIFQQLVTNPTQRKHPVIGPFFVNGVRKGEAISVNIKDIQLTSDYYQCVSFSSGVIPKFGDDRNYQIFPKKPDIKISGFTIKVNPSVGFLAATPSKNISCGRAGIFGGNLDIPDIKVTTKVHLPVLLPGGLIVVGDVHAIQGEGEISGTGAEVSAKIKLKIDKSPFMIQYPVIETATDFLVVGTGKYLNKAIQNAVLNSLSFLKNFSSSSRSHLYLALGLAGNISLGNSTGYIKTAAVKISKAIWTQKIY